TIYALILLILLGTFAYFLYQRPMIELMVNRQRGGVYQVLPDNKVSNHYVLQLFNKSIYDHSFEIQVLSHKDAQIILPGKRKIIQAAKAFKGHIIVILPQQKKSKGRLEIEFAILVKNKVIDTFKTSYLVPII
ncbi:hypothetical protein MJH12_11560, partial [bacterium]|nr:hypothetical protein [bacterium]